MLRTISNKQVLIGIYNTTSPCILCVRVLQRKIAEYKSAHEIKWDPLKYLIKLNYCAPCREIN